MFSFGNWYKLRHAAYVSSLIQASNLKAGIDLDITSINHINTKVSKLYSIEEADVYKIRIYRPIDKYNLIPISQYWVVVKANKIILKAFDEEALESILYFHARICLHKREFKSSRLLSKPNSSSKQSNS